MQKIFFSFVFTTLLFAAQAQQKTLFDNLDVHGGFGGPILEIGLGDDISTAVGGGGGILIGDFFIGGYGMGNTDDNLFNVDGNTERLDLGHGGLWMGYYTPSDNMIHFYGSARLGWGDIEAATNDSPNYLEDDVFVLTPEAGIELNVTSWFRIAGTVGYRFVTATENNTFYSGSDFSGTFAGLTFRFGGAF